MEKIIDGRMPSEGVVSKASIQPVRALGFRETFIRDIRKFATHINAALTAYALAEDGHSVWGMLFYLQKSEIEINPLLYVKLGQQMFSRLEQENMGADVADMHTRMRALGQTTQITAKAEYLMEGLLSNARGYEEGWTVAHLLHNMQAFADLKQKPQVSDDDRQCMREALQSARDERDASSIGWMHLRMRSLGEQTKITLKDKAIFWREYQKTSRALDSGRLDDQDFNDTVKTLVGLNYLYRSLIKQL